METKDLAVDQCGQGKVVEKISEVFPDVGIAIFPETFIVETVDLSDLSRFVVASEDGNTVGISDLESDKKGDCLDRIVTSVNVVTYRLKVN